MAAAPETGKRMMIRTPKMFCAALLAVALVAGCQDGGKQVTPEPDKAAVPQRAADYFPYVDQLDRGEITSIARAVEAYQSAFADATPGERDSGYVHFLNFQLEVETRLNNLVSRDPGRFASLAHSDSALHDTSAAEIAGRLQEFGYALVFDEGQPLVINDPVYLRRHFYAAMSPVMKAYFDQFELERLQPFAADGALLMPLPDIAARLIFWEKFVDAHPGFILMEEASLTYSYYVLVLLIGMDNTPAFDYQNQTLRKNFRDVYQLVVSKYPGSSSAAIFQEYLKLLRSSGWKQTEQVDEFVRQFAIL